MPVTTIITTVLPKTDPAFHPSDEDLSLGTPVRSRTTAGAESRNPVSSSTNTWESLSHDRSGSTSLSYRPLQPGGQ